MSSISSITDLDSTVQDQHHHVPSSSMTDGDPHDGFRASEGLGLSPAAAASPSSSQEEEEETSGVPKGTSIDVFDASSSTTRPGDPSSDEGSSREGVASTTITSGGGGGATTLSTSSSPLCPKSPTINEVTNESSSKVVSPLQPLPLANLDPGQLLEEALRIISECHHASKGCFYRQYSKQIKQLRELEYKAHKIAKVLASRPRDQEPRDRETVGPIQEVISDGTALLESIIKPNRTWVEYSELGADDRPPFAVEEDDWESATGKSHTYLSVVEQRKSIACLVANLKLLAKDMAGLNKQQIATGQDVEIYITTTRNDLQNSIAKVDQNLQKSLVKLEEGQTTMKQDISELKQDMVEVKQDISEMKQDMSEMKQVMSEMKHDIKKLLKPKLNDSALEEQLNNLLNFQKIGIISNELFPDAVSKLIAEMKLVKSSSSAAEEP